MVNQQNIPTGDRKTITHTSSIPMSSYFLPFYLAPKMFIMCHQPTTCLNSSA